MSLTSQPAAGNQASCGAPLTSGRLTTADAVELAKVLAALADPVRLQLVSLVAANGEVCSCDLQGPLGRGQTTTGQRRPAQRLSRGLKVTRPRHASSSH